VKLLNQEQELVNLLKRVPVGREELALLKSRASQLKNFGSDYNKQQRLLNPGVYQSLPIMLASFLFDAFLGLSPPASGEAEHSLTPTFYQNLGFEAACAVLGMRANASESAHPILCEGIRRQKGDLALNLLLTHKDEEQSLLKILDKLLDRDVYALFKADSVVLTNPFNPNFKKIQQAQHNEFLRQTSAQPSVVCPTVAGASNALAVSSTVDEASAASNRFASRQTTASCLYVDSLSSGWEESENESPNLSKNTSLLEAKYRCLSLSQQPVQQQKVMQKSSSGDESDASTSSVTETGVAKENAAESKEGELEPPVESLAKDGDPLWRNNKR